MSDDATEVVVEDEGSFDLGEDFSGQPDAQENATAVTQARATETPLPATEPKFVQITETDFQKLMDTAAQFDTMKAAHTKQFNTAFGKIGSVEFTLQQLQAATPLGQSVQATKEDFAELIENYGGIDGEEGLGEMTLKGLNRMLAKVKGTGGAAVDPAQIDQAVKESAAGLRDEYDKKLAREVLALKHEDWREIVGVPPDKDTPAPDTPYRQWLARQPDEYRASVSNSWDARVIAKSIDKFKAETAAAAAPAPPAGRPNPRNRTLQAAITPRGSAVTPQPKDADDETASLTAAFNSG